MLSASSILLACAALALVLALLLGGVFLLRRVGLVRAHGGGRLAVADSLALDPRRRLSLVRCDDRHVLLLTGGAQEVVVGWVDAPTPPAASRVVTGLMLLLAALLLPAVAHAQSVSVDLGAAGQAGATGRLIQLTALITLLSLAPSLLVMVTAFTRIVIVLSLLRSAMGTQTTPPNTVIIGLALFLTYFVMQPVLEQAWTAGLLPMTQGRVADLDGLRLAAEPFRKFMANNLRASDLQLFLNVAKLPDPATADQTPWRALIPAFMIGELRRAFEMGFLLFLPFLVIDLVVASVLMSLGMMMLPPNAVSLPFKLIFFVLVDGWRLVSGSLVESFTPK